MEVAGSMEGWLWTYASAKSGSASRRDRHGGRRAAADGPSSGASGADAGASAPRRCWFELSADGSTLVWRVAHDTPSYSGEVTYDEFSLSIADVTAVYVGRPRNGKGAGKSRDHGGGRARRRKRSDGGGIGGSSGGGGRSGPRDRRAYDIWEDDSDGGGEGRGDDDTGDGEDGGHDEGSASRRRYTKPSDRPYTFTVVTAGFTLLLQAPNAAEMLAWLHALRSAICGRLAVAAGADATRFLAGYEGGHAKRITPHGVKTLTGGPDALTAADDASSVTALSVASGVSAAVTPHGRGRGADWMPPGAVASSAKRTKASGAATTTADAVLLTPSDAALFAAVADSDARAVRRLLASSSESKRVDIGANVNARNAEGNTPLIVAAHEGDADMVGILLRRSAKVYATNEQTGETPLHAAAVARRGGVACIAMLVEAALRHDRKRRRAREKRAAHEGKRDGGGRGASSRGRRTKARGSGDEHDNADQVAKLLDVRSDGGLAPIHAAAAAGRPASLEALLVAGSDVWCTDDSGWTVAHYAAYSAMRCASPLNGAAAAALLEEHTAGRLVDGPLACVGIVCDVAVGLLEWYDSAGNTPLHVAASYGWTNGARMMLQTCADPHATNTEGLRPVDVARQGGHFEVALLLEYFSDSKGLAAAPPETLRGAGDGSGGKTTETNMARMMMIWERFFSNAIMGVEALEGDADRGSRGRRTASSRTSSSVTDSSTDDGTGDARLPGWHLEAKLEGVTWTRGHFARVSPDAMGEYGDVGYGTWHDADPAESGGYDYYGHHYGGDDAGVSGAGGGYSDETYVYQYGAGGGGNELEAGYVVGEDGFTYYYDESAAVWMVWDDTAQAWVQSGEASADTAIVTSSATAARAATTTTAASDFAWEELYDSDAGAAFYFNADTGESTWERPAAMDGAAAATAAAAAPASQALVPASAGVKVAATGDEGWWEQLRDDASGSHYWFNHLTLESTWDLPSIALPRSIPAAAVSSSVPLLLEDAPVSTALSSSTGSAAGGQAAATSTAASTGSGWTTHVDDATGCEYLYNESTGETMWSVDDSGGAGGWTASVDLHGRHDAAREGKSGEAESVGSGYGGSGGGGDSGGGASTARSGASAGVDDDGWETLWDSDAGAWYHYHHATGDAMWA